LSPQHRIINGGRPGLLAWPPVLTGPPASQVTIYGWRIRGAHLKGAIADNHTVWPDAFNAVSNGIKLRFRELDAERGDAH
jgi:hypothetical protein